MEKQKEMWPFIAGVTIIAVGIGCYFGVTLYQHEWLSCVSATILAFGMARFSGNRTSASFVKGDGGFEIL